MYKIILNKLRKENKVMKGKKEVTEVTYDENITLVDLDKRFNGVVMKSSDVMALIGVKHDGKPVMSRKMTSFKNAEAALGKQLTRSIDNAGVDRTKLHKRLGISSETLRKLEEDPLILDDLLKRRLRKQIAKILREGK